jgi:hypothetical protein
VTPAEPKRRRWWPLARLAIGLTLLGAVIAQVGGGRIVEHLRSIDPWYFGLGCVLLLLGQWLNALRWRWLLAAALPDAPRTSYLYALVIVGMFFNFLLPSTVGGDVVRAEMVKGSVGGRTHAYFSIVVARLLGFLGVLALGVLAVAGAFAAIGWFDLQLTLGAAVVVVPATAFAAWMLSGPDLSRLGSLLPARLAAALQRVQDALADYAAYPGVLWRVFVTAVIANAIGTVGVVWALAEGLSIDVPAYFHFIAVPLVMLVALVPVSINGIGLREGAFALLYAKVGVGAGAAVSLSLAFTAVLALLSVLGGLILLLPRRAWPGAARQAS